jgi:hypothetical protein
MSKRFLIEGSISLILGILVMLLIPVMQRKMMEKDAFAFWEAEVKANNRRLFGDAGDQV